MGVTVGSVIRRRRKAKGLTLLDLANAVGSDPGNISRLERSEQGYSSQQIKAIADALGCSLGTLFAEADDLTVIHDKEERELLAAVRAMSPEARNYALKMIKSLQ